MLVAVLIIFIIFSLIALAIVQRSVSGAAIVTESKQSHQAYQGSDTGAEKILNEIRKWDLDEVEIPENKAASEVCNEDDAMCYIWDTDAEGKKTSCSDTEFGAGDKVSDICKIKQSAATTNGKIERAVEVPVSVRATNIVKKGSSSTLTIENCKLGDSDCKHPNQCDLKISWETDGVTSKIDGFEIRRSTQKDLDKVVNPGDYGWRIAQGIDEGEDQTQSIVNTDTHYVLENGDKDLSPGSQSEQNYYFTIKAKNKNNFELDSLFSVPDKFKMPKNGDGCNGAGYGCYEKGEEPSGASLVSSATYTCCNGTECYYKAP